MESVYERFDIMLLEDGDYIVWRDREVNAVWYDRDIGPVRIKPGMVGRVVKVRWNRLTAQLRKEGRNSGA